MRTLRQQIALIEGRVASAAGPLSAADSSVSMVAPDSWRRSGRREGGRPAAAVLRARHAAGARVARARPAGPGHDQRAPGARERPQDPPRPQGGRVLLGGARPPRPRGRHALRGDLGGQPRRRQLLRGRRGGAADEERRRRDAPRAHRHVGRAPGGHRERQLARRADRDDAAPREERGRAPVRPGERPRGPGPRDGRLPHPRHERHLGRPRARRGGARRVLPPLLLAEERSLGREVPPDRGAPAPIRASPCRPGAATTRCARRRPRPCSSTRPRRSRGSRRPPARATCRSGPARCSSRPRTATASSPSRPSCPGARRASAPERPTSSSRTSR